MNTRDQFIALLAKVRAKHGSTANAFRAGGVEPGSLEGKSIRRLIELKSRSEEHAPRAWDLWALRGLLFMRKRGDK